MTLETQDEVKFTDVSIPPSGKGYEELFQKVTAQLSNEQCAGLLLQMIGNTVDKGIDKKFWLEVAETLGPDHCQTLYHGAVFASKVA